MKIGQEQYRIRRIFYALIIAILIAFTSTVQAEIVDVTITASWTAGDYDVSSTGPSSGALGIPEEDDDLVFGTEPSAGSTSFTLRVNTDSAVSFAAGYNGITHDWYGYSDVTLVGTHTFGSASWTTADILTGLEGVDGLTKALWTDTDIRISHPTVLSFRMFGDWEGSSADMFFGSRTPTTISNRFLMWEYFAGEEIRVSSNAYTAVAVSVSNGEASVVGVTYGPGWNMISLPVIPPDPTFDVIFPDATSALEYADGYQPVTTLDPCVGYWLNLTTGGDYTLTGTQINPCEMTLPSSWSMVGVPLSGTKVDDIVQNPADNLVSVFGFAGGYDQKTGQDLLVEGQGFWFFMADDGLVILNSDPGVAGRVVPVASEVFTGPVLWAESGEKRQEIRLDVEADLVTALPPLSPVAVLDIRVQIGDIGSSQVPRSDTSTEYTLMVQGFDVTLGWNVPEVERDTWALVLGDDSVPLIGNGAVDLGTHDSPVSLTLRRLVNPLPREFSLAQNYPNPFNPATTIRFDLPRSEEIGLAVYNLTGQKVATLVHGLREAGAYTLRWDGRDDDGRELASGVYLYRLEAGERVETRKLLLLR